MALNLTNQRFGRLVAIEPTNKRRGSFIIWCCNCDCGNKTLVTTRDLKSGNTQSCGCLNIDSLKARARHGADRKNARQPIYNIWANMRDRCYRAGNKRYSQYGGRGIRVCSEWNSSFESFRDYMLSLPNCPTEVQIVGSRLTFTIDRYPDNDGNYEPGNVRWATRSDQIRNRSNSRTVRINGIDIPLPEAVDKYAKASYLTVYRRLERGWSVKKAFMTDSTGIFHGK